NVSSGNASTSNCTGWPGLMTPANFSWMAVFSLRGFIATIVTTGMFSRMNSPGCTRSEEHTSELQSRVDLVCRLLLEKKNKQSINEKPSLMYLWNNVCNDWRGK